MYVIADYSDIVAFAIVTATVAGIVWAVRHSVLRFHPLVFVLLVVGGVVYFALPRVMFDTYMTDQRVPIGVAFMLFACGDLELRRRLVRRAFLVALIVLIAGRLIEIDLNCRNCRIRPASSARRCAASRPARKSSWPMPTARRAKMCATSASCTPPPSPPSNARRWSPRRSRWPANRCCMCGRNIATLSTARMARAVDRAARGRR